MDWIESKNPEMNWMKSKNPEMDYMGSNLFEKQPTDESAKQEDTVKSERKYWMPGDDYTRYDPTTKTRTVVAGKTGVAQEAARGGIIGKKKTPSVPIITAGGEYIVMPSRIIAKFGSLDAGHDALDQFVLQVREKNIKKLKNLAPPRK